jgi:hypothetical protein
MARAGIEGGFSSTVWTIDVVRPDRLRAHVVDEGDGPGVRRLRLQDFWGRHLSSDLRARVHCVTGDSYCVTQTWRMRALPPIDFFFIDGGHDYWTVMNDFMAALSIGAAGAVFLFDDYGIRGGVGVKRLVDTRILPACPPGSVQIIDTLAEQTRPESVEPFEHKMVLLETRGMTNPLDRFFPGERCAWRSALSGIAYVGRSLKRTLADLAQIS